MAKKSFSKSQSTTLHYPIKIYNHTEQLRKEIIISAYDDDEDDDDDKKVRTKNKVTMPMLHFGTVLLFNRDDCLSPLLCIAIVY